MKYIIQMVLYLVLAVLIIFLIQYFDVYPLEINFQNVLIVFVVLLVLRLLFYIFTKVFKLFIFLFVFLPVVALIIYVAYMYLTGQEIQFFNLDWFLNGVRFFI